MNNESNDFDDDFEHAVDAYEREDYKTAYKLFLPLAEQEDSDAQCYLGWIYENGHGVPKDIKEALKWFRLAAEQGDYDAQNNLGLIYAIRTRSSTRLQGSREVVETFSRTWKC